MEKIHITINLQSLPEQKKGGKLHNSITEIRFFFPFFSHLLQFFFFLSFVTDSCIACFSQSEKLFKISNLFTGLAENLCCNGSLSNFFPKRNLIELEKKKA